MIKKILIFLFALLMVAILMLALYMNRPEFRTEVKAAYVEGCVSTGTGGGAMSPEMKLALCECAAEEALDRFSFALELLFRNQYVVENIFPVCLERIQGSGSGAKFSEWLENRQ